MNQYERSCKKFLKDVKDQKRQSPLLAIRMQCLHCNGWQWKEMELCEDLECPLYFFRFGKNESGKKGSNLTARDGLRLQRFKTHD